MTVLLTGGAGYIGSVIWLALQDRGIDVVGIDDLSAGYDGAPDSGALYRGDFGDPELLRRVLAEHPTIDSVIHCAAKTIVPESVADPLSYYATNVGKSVVMLETLAEAGVHRVVFSSSASVYQGTDGAGLDEDAIVQPGSPYAMTKVIGERLLEDAASSGVLRAIALRYFNPIGADPALRAGQRNPAPSHVLGLLVAAHRAREAFTITGTDWPTRDGSGLRDFIHVWDVAQAHVCAIERFDDVVPPERPFRVINIGTGRGVTVRELVATFERVLGEEMPVREAKRRPGDVVGGYALVGRAEAELGWRAELTVEDGIRSSLEWAEKLGG